MTEKKIEILAPAGSYESFHAALCAGADAVYAGGNRFGARAYADNFTQEELIRAIDEAHLHGRKLYLTVNTLLKDREMDELYDYLAPLYSAGLDAVIVQDAGVLVFCTREFSGNGYSRQHTDDDHRGPGREVYRRAGREACCSRP